MSVTGTGTMVITGPTRGLGRALALEMAGRVEPERSDLLLLASTSAAVRMRSASASVSAPRRCRSASAHAQHVRLRPWPRLRCAELRTWCRPNQFGLAEPLGRQHLSSARALRL